VIQKDGKIIGEGFHRQFGGPHAEVNAINSVADKENLRGATLYVNLEPCSHYGKTPPCANLIVNFPFKRVVICNVDSNPLVAGEGIKIIADAGIQVEQGILEKEGRKLNVRFFTFMEKKRPYIILKWAETEDGFIARKDYSSKWISNEWSRKLVHKWRSEEDAVMVGTNTALHDNPQLNVRDWQGRDPLRIYIDKNLKVRKDSFLRDGSQKTICYNLVQDRSLPNQEFVKIDPTQKILDFILKDLYERKVQSVIVEGGAKLLQDFIDSNSWDETRVFKSKVKFGEGIKSPNFQGKKEFIEDVDGDQLTIYKS
jgi:diaminohydroxyphosphoribosylaminopyrimidine deaminase/5-amino-6-(5-phosphoribosylamino)uracil reductase